MSGSARVTVRFLADQLVTALAEIEKLKQACAKCPHADPRKIGFALADDDLANVRGGSLDTENLHPMDRDEDELSDPIWERGRRRGRGD